MSDLPPVELFAWVGEDELGSGVVGIKQAVVPAGRIPIVATMQHKVTTPTIRTQLGAQARRYRKTIRLVRFVPAEVVEELRP